MTNPLVAKLEQRDRLSQEEKRALDGLVSTVVTYDKGADLVREGERPTESKLLLDGFCGRYNVTSGGKRQITGLHVSGDFVDLHSFVLKHMDHGVVALTPCRVGTVPHEALRRVTEAHPHLTRLLWLNTALDGAMHRQAIVALGARDALGSMAHLLCELFLRLRAVGRTDGSTFHLPLTQSTLGDALGLSTVHVNRTIQDLRARRLIVWRGESVTIEDWDGLARVAEFDPTYLNLENEPR